MNEETKTAPELPPEPTIHLHGCCDYDETWKPGIEGWGATDQESRDNGCVSVHAYDELMDQLSASQRENQELRAQLAAIPARILEVMGAFSDDPLAVEDALRFLTQKRAEREDWEGKAEVKVKELRAQLAAKDERIAELEGDRHKFALQINSQSDREVMLLGDLDSAASRVAELEATLKSIREQVVEKPKVWAYPAHGSGFIQYYEPEDVDPILERYAQQVAALQLKTRKAGD